MLERLGPVERAVFLLHDVFAYGFAGDRRDRRALGRGLPPAGRAARRRVAEERPRFAASRAEREALADAVLRRASPRATSTTLVELLAADVVVQGDGGGKAPQWSRPIVGPDRVARLLAGLGRQIARPRRAAWSAARSTASRARSSARRTGGSSTCSSLEIADGAVVGVRSVINPDKLRHLGPVADVWAILRERAARGRP